MKTYDSIGIQIPRFLLPREGIDLKKWAVIACDQFTSQPDYWRQVDHIVGESPSTLNLVFPEVYIDEPQADDRIRNIHTAMHKYLEEEILIPYEGFVYVERKLNGKTRKGLVLSLDLERYNYQKGAKSLIRATEGTIVDRLPPRIRIREDAPIEVPHILVLIDDPQRSVIEPLADKKSSMKKLYDFDLMLDSGHLQGYLVDDSDIISDITRGLHRLTDPQEFSSRYDVDPDQPALLFAMGDGNHSLATAKAIWERIKAQVGMDHPARYALVEIENVHDEGLHFAPIHRVLFDLKVDIFQAMQEYFEDSYTYKPLASEQAMVDMVDETAIDTHRIGLVSSDTLGMVEISNPSYNIPVGSLQAFLNQFMNERGADRIDYVHGQEVALKLGTQQGNVGFYVPGMDKSDLFKTVIVDGVLPRKTFSMGEAREKRFYMESREIS